MVVFVYVNSGGLRLVAALNFCFNHNRCVNSTHFFCWDVYKIYVWFENSMTLDLENIWQRARFKKKWFSNLADAKAKSRATRIYAASVVNKFHCVLYSIEIFFHDISNK